METAGFSVENAIRLRDIENIAKGTDQNGRKLCDILIPIDEALKDYPKTVAKSGTEKILQNGGKIHSSQTKDALYDAKGLYRVYTASGVFVGLFRYSKEREELKPEKMFL